MADPHNMTPANPPQGRDKPLCGGRRRDGTGETCRRPAGWGTDHAGEGSCKLHGGSTPNHRKAAQVAQARRDVERYGGSMDIDPATALLQEVQRTAATVEYLRRRVNDLDEDDLTWGVAEETEKDGRKWKATPHPLVTLYQQERRHLAQVCKDALAAGATATIVEVYRQTAATYVQLVSRVLDRVVAGLDLSEEQRGRAPELVRQAFEVELEGIAVGGEAA